MIYLIESDSFIKIGYTENIERRFIQYKTDNPNFRILDVLQEIKLWKHPYKINIKSFVYLILNGVLIKVQYLGCGKNIKKVLKPIQKYMMLKCGQIIILVINQI